MTYRPQITEALKEWGVEKVDFKISKTLYGITKHKGIDEILKGILTNDGNLNLIYDDKTYAEGESYSYNDVNLSSDVELKFNNAAVNMTGTVTGGTLADYTLGEVNVINGTNTIALKCITIASSIIIIGLIFNSFTAFFKSLNFIIHLLIIFRKFPLLATLDFVK